MKILEVTKLTNERWLNLFLAKYENRGHTGNWIFASRREDPRAESAGDAVVLVPILRNPGEEPKLVLIKEFRIPAGGYLFGLPAGLIEKGESLEEAIRREIAEETGFTVTKIKRISPPILSSSGMTDESAVMAYIDVTGQPGAKQELEVSEVIEVMLLSHANVCELVNEVARFDAKAYLVLLAYAQMGGLE